MKNFLLSKQGVYLVRHKGANIVGYSTNPTQKQIILEFLDNIENCKISMFDIEGALLESEIIKERKYIKNIQRYA